MLEFRLMVTDEHATARLLCCGRLLAVDDSGGVCTDCHTLYEARELRAYVQQASAALTRLEAGLQEEDTPQ